MTYKNLTYKDIISNSQDFNEILRQTLIETAKNHRLASGIVEGRLVKENLFLGKIIGPNYFTDALDKPKTNFPMPTEEITPYGFPLITFYTQGKNQTCLPTEDRIQKYLDERQTMEISENHISPLELIFNIKQKGNEKAIELLAFQEATHKTRSEKNAKALAAQFNEEHIENDTYTNPTNTANYINEHRGMHARGLVFHLDLEAKVILPKQIINALAEFPLYYPGH